MKTLKVLLTCTISLSFISLGWSQQSISVELEDKAILTGDTYRGDIQWQSSNDGEVWSDYPDGSLNGLEVIIGQAQTYYRARITEDGCDIPHFSETIEIQATTTTKLWSDVNTWGSAGKPTEGDEVVIPEGEYIILDETPPALGGLTINGALAFDRQDLSLTSEWIVVHGTLRVGTVENPFEHQAVITLNDQDTNEDRMG
ncbi:MAG: G8 domain-containing protein, partial [Bacteroidota bacterium]